MTPVRLNPDTLSVLDRPNSYIGKTVPRPNLERLLQGRGLYVSDLELPRMAHVAFLRSPHAHAKILGIDATAAKRLPGVIAVVTGQEIAAVITPWVGVLSHLKGLKSAPQSAISAVSANVRLGPISVISSVASDSQLPTNRLAARCDHASIAPPTTTPKR